jgi:transcriptional regulator with XRE-family HTH domain
MASTFGSYFKEARTKKGWSLRQFCEAHGYDPGNISRLERGVFAPPESLQKLREYAKALALKEGSEEWIEFFDRAAASRGQLPADLQADEKLLGRLPVLFRTLRGRKATPQKLDQLVELLRGEHSD